MPETPPGHPSGAGRPSRLAAWVRGAVTERLGYKAAALFFASVLWLVARSEEPVEELVPVQLDPVFDSMRALDGPRSGVRALVAGRARDLLKLYNEPPVIRRAIPSTAPDTVRLDLRPADVLLPAGVDAIVRDVQPRVVTLPFAVRAARRVPVHSALSLVLDSIAAGAIPRMEPESVLVSGNRRAVMRIDAVRTIGGTLVVRDTASRTIPLDTAGLGVRVGPAHVTLRFTIPNPPPPPAPDTGRAPPARIVPRR